MRAVDIFANLVGQAISDGQVQRYGALLLTRRIAGLNPVIVWVDAIVAVLEAGDSYFRYCSACEELKQLREYNRVLETMLAQDFELNELRLKELRTERANRQGNIERELVEITKKIQISKRKVRIQLDHLKKIHFLLQQQRLRSGGFQELIHMQICLDSCIDATLALLLCDFEE